MKSTKSKVRSSSDGQVKLEFELVPATAWYSNVRSMVSKRDWDRLRKECYAAAGNVCEICGEIGEGHPVEAHEIWEYDDIQKIQKLVRLIALCPPCHSVKHIGNAYMRGVEGDAMAHFQRINQITDKQTIKLLKATFDRWEDRSKHEWTCDVSLLDQKGIPYDPERQRGENK